VLLDLHGPGGTRRRVHPDGSLTADPGGRTPVGSVRGAVEGFPAWGTARTPWRRANLELSGDTAQLERLLDTVNIV